MNEGARTHVELHVRIRTEQADRLKAIARATDRPLNQLIKDILAMYLEQHARPGTQDTQR